MIILMGQTKGGVGKSMLSANLAVYAVHEGKNVLLIDADKQQTTSKWASVRTVEQVKPVIQSATLAIDKRTDAKAFAKKIKALSEEYDDVIIDCGGQDSRELRTSLAIAECLIAPCRPSQADIWGLGDLDDLVKQVEAINPNLTATAIFNLADGLNVHNALGQSKEAIEELDCIQLGDVKILSRPTLASAYQDGQGARDLNQSKEPAKKATAEIAKLYNIIYG